MAGEVVMRVVAGRPRRLRPSMSGSQPLDTSTAIGRLMLAVIDAVGQAERDEHSAQSRYSDRQPEPGEPAVVRSVFLSPTNVPEQGHPLHPVYKRTALDSWLEKLSERQERHIDKGLCLYFGCDVTLLRLISGRQPLIA